MTQYLISSSMKFEKKREQEREREREREREEGGGGGGGQCTNNLLRLQESTLV